MNMFETKLSVAFAASLVAATILPAFAEGEHHQLQTVEATDALKIHLFNYDERYINDNGLRDYFTFRTAYVDADGNAFPTHNGIDADGFGDNRAKVLPKLGEDGYPVFDGRGDSNCGLKSLGYLFGAPLNPNGEPVKGVTEYVPENLPLIYNGVTGDYSYYSSKNACDYDTNSNRFVVWDYEEVSDNTVQFLGTNVGLADFLPFNHWDGYVRHVDYWVSGEVSGSADYNVITNVDYWFGYRIDSTFVMPPNGRRNGEDVVFEFSGDDDVWVFIDDVLVIDLGGTHGMCTGTLNFHTGEVSAYLDWDGKKTPSYPTSLTNQFAKAGVEPHGGWSTDGVTFADYSAHEMKVFYLERGGVVANMNLKFNLQPLPAGTISVSKSVTPATVAATDYGFTLHVETNGVQWIADVTTNGWPSRATLDTNNDVVFTLHAGGGVTDMIAFPGIPKDAVVTITEKDFAGMADFYGCYLVSTNDWRNGRTATFTNDYEGCTFSFINGYYDVDCLQDLWICDHATPEIGKVRLAVAPDLKTGVDAAGWIGSITNRYAFGLMNPDTGKLWGTNDVRLVGVENGAVWLETDLANVSNAHTKAILYKNQR